MIHWTLVKTFIFIFILSIVSTMVLEFLFRFLGVRGYLGNLFLNVRGGILKAGILPFIFLSLILHDYNLLVLIIGFFAFIDDVFGDFKSRYLGLEIGQLSRLVGFILVIIAGIYHGLGLSSIIIALMVQPLSISDTQPGSACMITLVMSIVTIILMLIVGNPLLNDLQLFYTPLIIFIIVLGYCPLDFSGKVMLGSVGNHSLAVALGCAFYLIGGFFWLLLLFILTIVFTAFIRRNTIYPFFNNLGIVNPNFGDLFMDVLTGGSVCDLLRKIFLEDRQPIMRNQTLIKLGFRRLLYNPYAPDNRRYDSNYRNHVGVGG